MGLFVAVGSVCKALEIGNSKQGVQKGTKKARLGSPVATCKQGIVRALAVTSLASSLYKLGKLFCRVAAYLSRLLCLETTSMVVESIAGWI